MSLIQTSIILSYAILLWGAAIALFHTIIAASEVVFARVEVPEQKKHRSR
ncbi:MAG TPA: hypothetical protein VI728_00450 [Syntrophales bacterium]|nr:hypothetical protein [Syntrophales bacterium]